MKTFTFGIALAALSLSTNAANMKFYDLHSGYCCSSANAINNSGQVVGYQAELLGNVSWTNATMWDINSGATTQLTTLIPNTFNFNKAVDINNSGRIVVTTSTGALLIDGNSKTQIIESNIHNSLSFTSLELNNNGSLLNSAVLGDSTIRSIFWTDPSTPDFPLTLSRFMNGMNDTGLPVGKYNDGSGLHATMFMFGLKFDLGLGVPWATKSEGIDINNNEQVIAVGYGANGGSRGFMWEDGHTRVLKSPGAASVPVSINEEGLVSGYKIMDILPGESHFLQTHAIIWDGHNQYDLNDLLDPGTKSAGWVLISANDINDNGVVVGQAFNTLTNETHAYAFDTAGNISPIPEPSTYLMLLAGLGLLGFMGRKKRS